MIAKSIIALQLICCLVMFSCFGKVVDYATKVAGIIDKYPELLAVLKLPADVNAAVLIDFKDLAVGAKQMKDDFAAIPDGDLESRAKHLAAVRKYEATADAVFARGHFNAHPRLKNVETALKAVITAAKIFYSVFPISPQPAGTAPESPAAQKARVKKNQDDVEQKIKDLERAMKP